MYRMHTTEIHGRNIMNVTGTEYQYSRCDRYNSYKTYSNSNTDIKQNSESKAEYNNQSRTNTDKFVRTSSDYAYAQYAAEYKANITVDPEFLAKTENDPELKAKYLSDVEDIKQADMLFSKQQSANGVKIISQGWFIDKNGDISSWVISKTERGNEKSLLQRMNENLDKIRTKKAKKKIEEEKRRIAIQKRKIENEKKLLALKKKKKVGGTGKMFCTYA